ncbi:MAG: Lhr family helicase, partial [Vicinamibacterales bacterium]
SRGAGVPGAQSLDALLDAIEHLQGAPLAASTLEGDVLAARLDGYGPGDLDALLAAGEVVWRGVDSIGDRDGRVALYLTDHFPRLWRPAAAGELSPRERAIVAHLDAHGAAFFAAIHEGAGGGYPGETVDALWDLVWKGLVTNDTFHALRAFTRGPVRPARKPARTAFRSRRAAPPSAEGRWSLLAERTAAPVSDTQWSTATAQQLLSRYGIVTREVAAAEGLAGGFGAVYGVLKALEDAGRVRRGYFVSGVGAVQFALPPALDLLRSLRDAPDEPEVVVAAATDPANPFGTMLKWPGANEAPGRGPTRSVGALVILVNGSLAGYLPRGGRQLFAYVPDDEPARSVAGRGLAKALASLARDDRREGLLLTEINGGDPSQSSASPYLIEAGFYAGAMGLHLRPKNSHPASARVSG